MTWREFIHRYLSPRKSVPPEETVVLGMSHQQLMEFDKAVEEYFAGGDTTGFLIDMNERRSPGENTAPLESDSDEKE